MGGWKYNGAPITEMTPVVSIYNFLSDRYFNFHVNVFIIISGYFGIRNSIRKGVYILLLLWWYLFFFNAITFFSNGTINLMELLNPIQERPWWFMCNYIYLVLLAPFINTITDSYNNCKQWQHIIGICLLFNVYFCWLLKDPKLNFYGHNLVTFVTMYIVGRWISSPYSKPVLDRIKMPWGGYSLSFVVFTTITTLFYIINYICKLGLTLPDYNSPIMLLGGVLFFMMFLNWKLSQNRFIVFLSESAVAVYLVHEYPIGREFVSMLFGKLIISFNDCIYLQVLLVPIFVIVLYFTICLVDKIRLYITKPLNNYINRIIE